MKRIVSIFLVLALLISSVTFSVSAEQVTEKTKTTVEYYSDGSYSVTILEETNSLARTAKSGKKSKIYYTASDVPIFSVNLTGTFSYTYGVSAEATGSSVVVSLYDDNAVFVTKSATYRNATAYGSGTVSYLGLTRAMSTNITCDIYGNLS